MSRGLQKGGKKRKYSIGIPKYGAKQVPIYLYLYNIRE